MTDYTQGFGSFNFAPPNLHCENIYLTTSASLLDADADLEVNAELAYEYFEHDKSEKEPEKPAPSGSVDKQPSNDNDFQGTTPIPFPFMNLPLELRFKIYRLLTAPLRGWTHERNQRPDLCRPQDMVFHIASRAWDPSTRDENIIYDLAVAEPVEQRTIDSHRPWEDQHPVDVHAAYVKIQDGTAQADEIPTGWAGTAGWLSLLRRDTSELEESETSSEGYVVMDDDDDNGETNIREPGPAGYQTILQPRMHIPEGSSCVYHPSQPNSDTTDVHVGPEQLEKLHELHDTGAKCTCPHTTRAEYTTIRYLAQVSPQITAELGSVLWQGAVLVFPGPEDFARFAADRPAVLGRVKGIRLAVSCHGDAFDTVTSELAEMLGLVTERCSVLRFFWVDVSVDVDAFVLPGENGGGENGSGSEEAQGRRSAAEMRARRRMEEWTPLFRGLKTERFRVGLDVHGPRGITASSRERREAVRLGMVEMLWEMWKPDSVRDGEAWEREKVGREGTWRKVLV
ncbi:hypothetical protein B0T19DRAFT_479479 [Cercophora scortea]|uniref:Uncharacterized protein n=1 Tax=Cercophora scortea TaxID=314031 RepID=A0AAE0M341_9PEZI|nr:hypothetical protein B0T19DRAFT_479479 [Cercophora scortea]